VSINLLKSLRRFYIRGRQGCSANKKGVGTHQKK